MKQLPLVALLLAAPAAWALEAPSPGPGWELANKKKEFVIFTKDDEASGSRRLIAITEVDSPPEAVFKTVGDFDNYANFMPYVKKGGVVERKDGTLLVYTHLSPPLVSDRDYYIRVRRTAGSEANGGVFKSEWVSEPDFKPEEDGIVRVRLNTGSWMLEPLDEGRRTRVTYTLLTDPGGSIPRWIANKSNTTAIPDLFKAVKKRSQEFAQEAKAEK